MRAKWIILVAALIVLGALIGGISAAVLRFDFTRLNTESFETRTYEVSGSFRDISIHGRSDDITLRPSEDGTCRVVCREDEHVSHTVSTEGGTLSIETVGTRPWHMFIGVSFESPDITVYLPQGTYGAFTIETTSGDIVVPAAFSFESAAIRATTADVTFGASVAGSLEIRVTTGDYRLEGLSVGALQLFTSSGDVTAVSVACAGPVSVHAGTGDIALTDMTCASLSAEGSSGDVTLRNLTAEDTITIRYTTSDVRFEHCDAATLSVKTTTGDITGTLRTDKLFRAHATTGDVRVPDTVAGGLCELTTTTGDIAIAIG